MTVTVPVPSKEYIYHRNNMKNMSKVTLDELKKHTVVSQDAYNVGEVLDVRYDVADWSAEGLKIKCSKDVSNIIGAGSSKSMILIRPPSFRMHDVILIPDTVEGARPYIRADTEALGSVSALIGKKIYTCDQQIVGSIDSVDIDTLSWKVHSFSVKLDKSAHDLLGIKKGLGFMSKSVTGITVNHVSTVAEIISLTLNMDQVRDVVSL